MTDLASIKKIAQQTRAWAHRHRHKVDVEEDLCGMCAIAAGELHKRLKVAGFSAVIALRNTEDEGHAFVICEGHIVDVTATQFGWITTRGNNRNWERQRRLKPVEIVPLLPKKDRPYFWQETAQYDSTKKLLARQKKSGWPTQQLAWLKTPRHYIEDDEW